MHWPTSRCHGSSRSIAARKSRSTARTFRGLSTEFELRVYWRNSDAMVALTESWLQQRTAHVVLEGQFSDLRQDGLQEHGLPGHSVWP